MLTESHAALTTERSNSVNQSRKSPSSRNSKGAPDQDRISSSVSTDVLRSASKSLTYWMAQGFAVSVR